MPRLGCGNVEGRTKLCPWLAHEPLPKAGSDILVAPSKAALREWFQAIAKDLLEHWTASADRCGVLRRVV